MGRFRSRHNPICASGGETGRWRTDPTGQVTVVKNSRADREKQSNATLVEQLPGPGHQADTAGRRHNIASNNTPQPNIPEPRELGFAYDQWRPSQLEALAEIAARERSRRRATLQPMIFLNAPTGSGKTAIALAWAIMQHRSHGRRTIIMAERRAELDQYERVITPITSSRGDSGGFRKLPS